MYRIFNLISKKKTNIQKLIRVTILQPAHLWVLSVMKKILGLGYIFKKSFSLISQDDLFQNNKWPMTVNRFRAVVRTLMNILIMWNTGLKILHPGLPFLNYIVGCLTFFFLLACLITLRKVSTLSFFCMCAKPVILLIFLNNLCICVCTGVKEFKATQSILLWIDC